MPLVFILLAILFITGNAIALPSFSVKTVVIDAGHGGKDPGAIGPNKTREKDVALAVSLLLGKKIKESFPDVKVIYTRTGDVFVPLIERANIANRSKADLFISIHCNASTNRSAIGSSTYVLGLHKTEENLEVAKRENAVIELEEDVDKNYDFNPNSPEGHIIMSMKQNAYLEQSIDIAARIEQELTGKKNDHISRGVKQAGFFVLFKTSMPALLAEIGFISNPNEEMYLASKEGQDEIAEGIFRAFSGYKNSIEKNSKFSASNDTGRPSVSPKTAEANAEESLVEISNMPPKYVAESSVSTSQIQSQKNQEKAALKEDVNSTIINQAKPVQNPPNISTAYNETPSSDKAKTLPISNNKPFKENIKLTDASSNDYMFYLQIVATLKPPKDYEKIKNAFGNIRTETLPNGYTRYMVGHFSTYQEAEKLIPKAKAFGFHDAFVIAYKNGVRLEKPETDKLKTK